MNKENQKSLRQQVDETVIDVRNEIIVQGTNAFLLGRQLVLTGIGLTFLGVDQVQALVQQAVARGADVLKIAIRKAREAALVYEEAKPSAATAKGKPVIWIKQG